MLDKKYFYINGEWVAPKKPKEIEVINPSTEEISAIISLGSSDDTNIAVKAGKKSFGSTMYVTLEPCNHESYNGSCTNQIIRSGIKKIFIAMFDPDPRTNNKSIKKYSSCDMTKSSKKLQTTY